MRLLFLLFSSAVALFSQPFSFGVRAGVPLTDFVNAVNTQNFAVSSFTNRYVIGPTVELRLPFGLGVSFDALYRHFGASAIGLASVTDVHSGEWEFPLMAKYRFPSPIVRPYVAAGVAWDRLQGLGQTVTVSGFSTSPVLIPVPQITIHKDTIAGFIAGVGLDIHALLLHVSPEIRYTRWGDQHFISRNSILSSNQNQAEFLVGITF